MIVPIYTDIKNRKHNIPNSIIDLYGIVEHEKFLESYSTNFCTEYFATKLLSPRGNILGSSNNQYRECFTDTEKFTYENFIKYFDYINEVGIEKVFDDLKSYTQIDFNSNKDIFVACFHIDEYRYLKNNFETLNIKIFFDENIQTDDVFDIHINYNQPHIKQILTTHLLNNLK